MPFSHHPHCDKYHNHLIWFFERPFCLGCLCAYLGIFLGLCFGFYIEWNTRSEISWALIFLAILLPSFLQPWLQIKIYKVISRTLLGVAVGLSLHGIFKIETEISRILFIIIYLSIAFSLYKLFIFIRNSNLDNPCNDCELGVYPTCDWNLNRLIQTTGNQKLINDIFPSSNNSP